MGLLYLHLYTTFLLVWTGVQLQALTALPQETQLIPETTGWTCGPVWTDRKSNAPTGIRTPERPVRWEVGVVTRAYILRVF